MPGVTQCDGSREACLPACPPPLTRPPPLASRDRRHGARPPSPPITNRQSRRHRTADHHHRAQGHSAERPYYNTEPTVTVTCDTTTNGRVVPRALLPFLLLLLPLLLLVPIPLRGRLAEALLQPVLAGAEAALPKRDASGRHVLVELRLAGALVRVEPLAAKAPPTSEEPCDDELEERSASVVGRDGAYPRPGLPLPRTRGARRAALVPLSAARQRCERISNVVSGQGTWGRPWLFWHGHRPPPRPLPTDPQRRRWIPGE